MFVTPLRSFTRHLRNLGICRGLLSAESLGGLRVHIPLLIPWNLHLRFPLLIY